MDVLSKVAEDLEAHLVAICLMTSLAVFIFAGVIRSFQKSILTTEIWAQYFYIFFLIVGCQFGSRAAFYFWNVETAAAYAGILGSGLNNVFALATALALFRTKRAEKNESVHKPFFPWWNWGVAFLCTVLCMFAVYRDSTHWGYIVPETLFSIFILMFLGLAIFRNMLGGKLNVITGNLTLGLLAVSVFLSQVLYALANSILLLYDIIGEALRLDPLIYAVALPFKIMLFVGGLLLLKQSIALTHSKLIRETLSDFHDQRSDPLVPGGIVKNLGLDLDAARVRLLYKRPGSTSLHQVYWMKGEAEAVFVEIPARLTCEAVRESFETGEVVIRERRPTHTKFDQFQDVPRSNCEFVWVLPLVKNAGVIGCLTFVWFEPVRCTIPLLERLKLIADLISPAVHHSRQMLAFQGIQKEFRRIEEPDKECIICEMTRILFRNLGAWQVGLQLDIGFSPKGAVIDDSGLDRWEGSKQLTDERFDMINGKTLVKKVYTIVEPETEIEFGKLMLGFVESRGGKEKPALGYDWLFRDALIAMIASCFLDLTRRRHQESIRGLLAKLYEMDTFKSGKWYTAISKHIKDVRAAWVVACSSEKGEMHGPYDARGVLEKLDKPAKTMVCEDTTIAVHHLPHSVLTAESAVRLSFGETVIWLGFPRKEFGNELIPHYWTWREYLGRLGRHAGEAVENLKLRGERIRSLEYKHLSVAAVITNILMHQIKNQVSALALTTDDIREGIRLMGTKMPPEIMKQLIAIQDPINNLRSQTVMVNDITKLNSKRPCRLSDAVNKALKLYEHNLQSNNINILSDIPSKLEVDLPFNVICLAIANLLGNSLYAIEKAELIDGLICIEAQTIQNTLEIKIIDNGPGIPEDIINRVFELGVSSKQGSHGSGLFLTRRSLEDLDADIELISSEPGKTEFCISCPARKSERNVNVVVPHPKPELVLPEIGV